LDEGVASDYHADQEPLLMTSFPMIFGRSVEDVAVRNLTLDGNRDQQPAGIGSCRGAAVYFIQSRRFEVRGVVENGFHGEGLGFQMCRDVRIRDCAFNANTGNGYHPGAGSTAALFENCVAEGNGAAGFFFCVRANHISARGCTFADNMACGVSVGTRDCHNLIEACRITANKGPGILFRRAPRPVEVHSVHVRGCQIVGNAQTRGQGQISVLSDAHDLIFEGNQILGHAAREQAGIYLSPATERIWLANNQIEACSPPVIAPDGALAAAAPAIACGVEVVEERDYRHLAADAD
ncbi:MAG: right-handed parallel beta-helix repeat-containing protein, partial [Anaerolineae bacterium]|nr:right-handed parallel beta-helix repeat-containing protein [Anaerolineae bacterium]